MRGSGRALWVSAVHLSVSSLRHEGRNLAGREHWESGLKRTKINSTLVLSFFCPICSPAPAVLSWIDVRVVSSLVMTRVSCNTARDFWGVVNSYCTMEVRLDPAYTAVESEKARVTFS